MLTCKTLAIRKEQYDALKKVPPNHRGYQYMLRGGSSNVGSSLDLDIGFEVACPASSYSDGISSKSASDLDGRIDQLIMEDHGVRVMPFLVTDKIAKESEVKYSDIEAMYRYLSGIGETEDTRIKHFLLLTPNGGVVIERPNPDASYYTRPMKIQLVEGLKPEEIKSIEEKQAELRSLGFNV
ncbi:MAG: hypothetical protein KJ709_04110 [Nanoarchaeota archaeon]|nr:hypothetical protein [Nanoarchaeota archaeon]